LEKIELEQNQHIQWKFMFSSADHRSQDIKIPSVDQKNEHGVTVVDFINHLKKKKVISVHEIATQYGVTEKQVTDRLKSFEKDGRIQQGIFDGNGNYIYMTLDIMRDIAFFVKTKGKVTMDELANECDLIISKNIEKH